MSSVPRQFAPIAFPADWGTEGWRAVHYLRPQTMFADRLAHAIERASELTSLAAHTLTDPSPEVAGAIARRAIELAVDLEWLELHQPTKIHPEDEQLVDLGLAFVQEGVAAGIEAFQPAMLVLDQEIRETAASAPDCTGANRGFVEELRNTWADNIDGLTEGIPENDEHPLIQRMLETVRLLDEALA